MPKASLPNSPAGWIVALVSSFVGFIAGFIAIAVLTNVLEGR